MTKLKLSKILEKHCLWLFGEPDGKRADLHGAKLRSADLHYANLCEADLRIADLRGAGLCDADLHGATIGGADLRSADLRGAKLCGADFCGADLRGVKLCGADLHDADIDFSCWPIWCGGLHVKIDKRVAAQLAYFFCAQDCDDPDYIKSCNAIFDFANTYQRAKKCGLLDKREIKS